MFCTLCHAELLDLKGKGSYSCSRFDCESFDYDIYNQVLINNHWWFAARYTLPFSYNDNVFLVAGPKLIDVELGERTVFYKIQKPQFQFSNWTMINLSSHVKLFDMPYMALPVNEDFVEEYNKLFLYFKKYVKFI